MRRSNRQHAGMSTRRRVTRPSLSAFESDEEMAFTLEDIRRARTTT